MITIGIKPLTRLFAEEARLYHPLLGERGFEARIVEKFFKNSFRYFVVDIMADEVHQLKRLHAKVSDFLHRPINSRDIGDSFFKLPDSFAVKWTSYPIHNESGCIFGHYRGFAPIIDQLASRLGDFRTCGDTGKNFYEGHHRSAMTKVASSEEDRMST